ncbi:DUF4194 domain-containing protein [Gordonia rubripertincta]|uniref:DUF4194 domain-containing protein n=1 Tax=Gordonia rubripertincta TaxID=36822 RepID=A0ABT4MR15_GORRU|nr:DUF4194 domain-containing protein [Gordonia rubripertincta]MCZ4549433.1 DUF4194 domain-containing protein [Gordonia rubripertincta]
MSTPEEPMEEPTDEQDLGQQEGEDLFVDDPGALTEPSVDLSHFAFDGSEPVGTISDPQVDARFDGDTSALPAPVCYALQELVAAAHVSVRSRNWKTIEVHEEVIRSRLSELNLQLEINREHKYAFTRQVSENDPRQRNILRAQTLTLAASVLALFLRQKYLTSADESVVAERGEIMDHMLTYKPVSDTDEAGFIKRIDAAINQLESRKIIRALPGTDRYVVHGVIASLLGPEQVAAYTEAYRRLAGEHAEDGTDLTELDDRERTT